MSGGSSKRQAVAADVGTLDPQSEDSCLTTAGGIGVSLMDFIRGGHSLVPLHFKPRIRRKAADAVDVFFVSI